MRIGFNVVGHKRKTHPVLEYPWDEHGYEVINLETPDDVKDIDIYYQLAYHEEKGKELFNAAVRLKKRIVLHWLGFDVWRVMQGKLKAPFDVKDQFCQTIGNHDELMGHNMYSTVNTVCPPHPGMFSPQPLGDNITVHMPNGGEFYYYDVMREVAVGMPDEQFVFYSCRDELDLPDNCQCVQWLDDESELIEIITSAKAHVRLAQHDGFPHSVIQHKMMGRHVISNNAFPYVTTIEPTSTSIMAALMLLVPGVESIGSKFYHDFYTPDNFIKRFKRGLE